MRKYSVLVFLIALAFGARAQSEFEALRSSQSDIVGTARFVSMSGAFGALGGDMSAISMNPAGIGVYRSSELSVSPAFQMDVTNTNLNGTDVEATKSNILLNGFGYVGSFRTYDESAISNFNFGITYNRTADFNRNTNVIGTGRTTSLIKEISFMENYLLDAGSPYTTPYWNFMNMSSSGVKVLDENGSRYFSRVADNELSNSDMQLLESGGINSWNFTLGANYNHTLYVGLGLGIQRIYYEKSSSYIEDFTINKGIELRNTLTTSGSGLNFKAGLIYRPVPELRFGFSFNTGTYYTMTDVFAGSMASWGFTDPNTNQVYPNTQKHIEDEQYVDYRLKTPWQITMSAAYMYGKQGLLNIDVDYVDNSSINLKDVDGYEYTDINNWMNGKFAKSLNLRIGGEARLTDNLSLRLGGAYYMSPVISNLEDTYVNTPYTRPDYSMIKNTMYASMGVGYRSGAFFTDVAVQERLVNEHFFNYYDDISMAGEPKYAELTRDKVNLVITAGVKF